MDFGPSQKLVATNCSGWSTLTIELYWSKLKEGKVTLFRKISVERNHERNTTSRKHFGTVATACMQIHWLKIATTYSKLTILYLFKLSFTPNNFWYYSKFNITTSIIITIIGFHNNYYYLYYDCHHHHHDFLFIDEEGWGRSSPGCITINGEAAHKNCWESYRRYAASYWNTINTT